MSANNVKPAYNAKRRIQYLFGLVILLIAGCTAGWYFVASKLESISTDTIAQQARLGNIISCEGNEVRGYPFRFGLFCDSVAFESQPGGIKFTAGALRSAAQFYAPRDLIIELDSPAEFDRIGGDSWSVNWSQMRARILATEPLPQNISLFGQQIVLGHKESSSMAKAEGLELFMRVVDQDVDIAGRTSEFEFGNKSVQLNQLPPLGGDFDLRISDGVNLLLSGQQSLRGHDVMLNRMAVLLNDDRGIIVSGPFSVADNGLLSGKLKLRVIDVDGVLAAITKALPDVAPMVTAFVNGQPRKGENVDEIELQIDIDAGRARLGLIPLGTIPPL